MHRVTQIAIASLTCTAVALFGASASFAAAQILPGAAKTAFTITTGKVLFQVKGGAAVACKAASGSGELTSSTAGTGKLDFTGCSTAGLGINSLGDASATVLIAGEATICDIGKSTVGVDVHLPSTGVHLEVPSTKLLLIKKGSFIIEATPVGTKTKSFKGVLQQSGGVQAIEKCEGGSKETLLLSTDGGEFIQAGLEAQEVVLAFPVEEELMT
jgi:hypothetical protein